MDGYLGDPAATARVLRDGWLDTGDLGFLDARGELFLVGRLKDLVIVRGRNHAPEEIEEAVAAVAGVRPGGVAAVGWLPERAAEEELLLLVERTRGDAGRRRRRASPAPAATRCAPPVGVEAGRVAVLAPRRAAAHLVGQAPPRRGAATLLERRARRRRRRHGRAVARRLGGAGLSQAEPR
jgi:acyl-CoA synthetase (AMP-forming)/AMP-acid ligase II